LQPSGQHFELPVCAEFVQAVNADLNRLSMTLRAMVAHVLREQQVARD